LELPASRVTKASRVCRVPPVLRGQKAIQERPDQRVLIPLSQVPRVQRGQQAQLVLRVRRVLASSSRARST
jgi:hypothetical protein